MGFFQAGQRLTAAALNSVIPATAFLAANQTVNSTTPAAVSGFAFPVSNGNTYVATCWFIIDANSGGDAQFRFTGPTASLTIMGFMLQQENTLDAYQVAKTSNSTGYNSGTLDTGVTFAATFYIAQLWGTFTMTADGTLGLSCANATGASDTFTLYAGSWMSVQQVQS